MSVTFIFYLFFKNCVFRYRYKEQPLAERDRGGRDRDRDLDRDREKDFRDNRGFSRERDRERDFRDREPRDRDHQYYEGFDRERGRGRPPWNPTRKDYTGPSDQYYHQPDMTTQPPPFVPSNRYLLSVIFLCNLFSDLYLCVGKLNNTLTIHQCKHLFQSIV